MPNRRASTARTRPGQNRTTRPKSRATRPRSARARQLEASVFNLCWQRPSLLTSMPSSEPLRNVFILLFSCVRRKAVVDSSVELSTQQHHRSAEVEIEEQTYGSTNAPVGGAVVGEVGQIERETHRGDRPKHHGNRRAWDH